MKIKKENLEYVDCAKRVFDIEIDGLQQVKEAIAVSFSEVVTAILSCQGKVVISGVGKSGIIGKKIAATLASVGTPSFFMHPGEAYHGDLGMVQADDIALLLSNSGETEEILRLLPFFQRVGVKVISMIGEKESTLGKNSFLVLNTKVDSEACPLKLAPTTSSTACLVLGDALAIALMQAKGFNEENYAQFHPGGSLGKKLLTKVEDVMKTREGITISMSSTMPEVVVAMTSGRCGLAVVIDDEELIQGVITDGDLRRAIEKYNDEFLNKFAKDIMTRNPMIVRKDDLLFNALETFKNQKITALIVAEDRMFRGVLEVYDQ